MYFDSLTFTGIGFFVAALLLVVRFCIFGLCGGPDQPDQPDQHDDSWDQCSGSTAQ